jgi:hypothetical protein
MASAPGDGQGGSSGLASTSGNGASTSGSGLIGRGRLGTPGSRQHQSDLDRLNTRPPSPNSRLPGRMHLLPGVRPRDPPQRETLGPASSWWPWKKVGCFKDNDMAVNKARLARCSVTVPSLGNVFIYVGRRTIVASQHCLCLGARYFEQLFSNQMTTRRDFYVSDETAPVFIWLKSNCSVEFSIRLPIKV